MSRYHNSHLLRASVLHLKSMVLVLIAKTTVYMHLRALHCTANYTLCFWTNKIYFIKTPGHNWLSQCLFTKDSHRYIMHIYTWQVFKHQKSTVKYLTVHTHVFVLSNFLAKHFGGCMRWLQIFKIYTISTYTWYIHCTCTSKVFHQTILNSDCLVNNLYWWYWRVRILQKSRNLHRINSPASV